MKVKDFLELPLPRYSNKLTKGEHKNGNIKGVYVMTRLEERGWCYHNANDILTSNNTKLLESEIAEIVPIVLSAYKGTGNAGLQIYIRGDGNE